MIKLLHMKKTFGLTELGFTVLIQGIVKPHLSPLWDWTYVFGAGKNGITQALCKNMLEVYVKEG
jgi:hypothetical protein